LNGYSTMGELPLGLKKYFDFYNSERPHQALENQTPQSVDKSASGGGAMMIEKFNKTAPENDVPVMAKNQGSAVQPVGLKVSSLNQRGIGHDSWVHFKPWKFEKARLRVCKKGF